MVHGLPGGWVVKNPLASAGVTVWSLVWEDPTCHEATPQPVLRGLGAGTTESTSHSSCSPHSQSLCSATREITSMRSLPPQLESSPRSLQLEKSPRGSEDPGQPEQNKFQKRVRWKSLRKENWFIILLQSWRTAIKISVLNYGWSPYFKTLCLHRHRFTTKS